ncbi:MAG: transcription termination/antitermination protein NusA [Candidatus Pacebacteria bacterium]|nr:transcription termination/antitermination protein NusA [Candidatus Paceibacterota bacterium]
MFDLKVINSVLAELEEERGIPRASVLEAISTALATAYKKEYGKRGQVVRAKFDIATGDTEFYQVKFVVDESRVWFPLEEDDESAERPNDREEVEGVKQAGAPEDEDDDRVRYDAEKHMLLEDARRIKKDVQVDDEMVFPLETQDEFGRIAAQTAKQVIIQKIREAEKVSILGDYEGREGEIVSGTVQRVERGNIWLDLGRTQAIMPYDEQIPGERFRQGERVRAYLYSVEEGPRGVMIRVSRSHPRLLMKLFEQETPELTSGAIVIKAIAREPGSRSKVAVHSNDPHVDPVGALVGQRGVRVSTVMSELGGEKIDIIEWSEETAHFIEDALSPAKVLSVEVDENERRAVVEVAEDQQSLAIGRGGQNVRLAAKLTGWRIDIHSTAGDSMAESDQKGEVTFVDEVTESSDQIKVDDEITGEVVDDDVEVSNEDGVATEEGVVEPTEEEIVTKKEGEDEEDKK